LIAVLLAGVGIIVGLFVRPKAADPV